MPHDLDVSALACFALGLAGIVGAVLALRRHGAAAAPFATSEERRLRAGPLLRVADARPGDDVCVRGTVRALRGQSAPSPLSGSPVVLWSLVATRQRKKIRTIVLERRGGVDFLVDDGTGVVRVPGRAARLSTRREVRIRAGDASDRAREIFREAGRPWDAKLDLAVSELAPGDRVVVCGVARSEPDPDRPAARVEGDGYRGAEPEIPTRLVLEPTPEMAVLVGLGAPYDPDPDL